MLSPDMAQITTDYINQLAIPKGAKVLEIGAGTGRATFDLGLAAKVAQQGGTLVALEPSAALNQVLRKKSLKHGGNIEIVQGVAEDLPFPDNAFDLVVSVFVLHFTDLQRAVAEMSRVIKPGGTVSALVPQEASLFDIPMVARWFHPLKRMAEGLGVSLGERQGVTAGLTRSTFQECGLMAPETLLIRGRVSASDPRSFLQMILKGAAFLQNILSRIPFQERWRILRHLEEQGEELAAITSIDEQQVVLTAETVQGKLPFVVKAFAES